MCEHPDERTRVWPGPALSQEQGNDKGLPAPSLGISLLLGSASYRAGSLELDLLSKEMCTSARRVFRGFQRTSPTFWALIIKRYLGSSEKLEVKLSDSGSCAAACRTVCSRNGSPMASAKPTGEVSSRRIRVLRSGLWASGTHSFRGGHPDGEKLVILRVVSRGAPFFVIIYAALCVWRQH